MGYIGRMEKKMETTLAGYRGNGKMETTIVGYVGIMERKWKLL